MCHENSTMCSMFELICMFSRFEQILDFVISPCQAYKSDRYCVMLYRDLGSWIGIRIKKGKQIFSFGRGCDLTEKSIRMIADKALKKLDEGDEADEVRTWARAECAK